VNPLLPKAWIKDRKKEFYYKKAKAENYRSRATYKLAQAAEKYGFIQRHAVIVDLGAAPGGWIQAAKKVAGNRCFILGVDLKPIEAFPQEYVRTIIGDMTDPELPAQILSFLPRKADVLLSDASQNISGVWEVDHARQLDLAEHALEVALKVLRPSGNFFVKVFEGDLLDDFVAQVKKHFEEVKVVKPPASRQKSSEMYVLGMQVKNAQND
jgi:23S rRNA (uridine2552-2'-O)-methyltransferase